MKEGAYDPFADGILEIYAADSLSAKFHGPRKARVKDEAAGTNPRQAGDTVPTVLGDPPAPSLVRWDGEPQRASFLDVLLRIVDAVRELNPRDRETQIVIPDRLGCCFRRPLFRFFSQLSVFRRKSPALGLGPHGFPP
jgi:hypothetical protein